MVGLDNSLPDVTKLSECENYGIWKFRMRQLFQKEDLWELVQPPTIIVHLVVAKGPGEVEGAAPTTHAAPATPVAFAVDAITATAAALSLVKRRN
jgi:hypothetical protein